MSEVLVSSRVFFFSVDQVDPDPEFSTVIFPNPEEGALVLVRRERGRERPTSDTNEHFGRGCGREEMGTGKPLPLAPHSCVLYHFWPSSSPKVHVLLIEQHPTLLFQYYSNCQNNIRNFERCTIAPIVYHTCIIHVVRVQHVLLLRLSYPIHQGRDALCLV